MVDLNDRRFGKYTPGWPLLLAAGVILGDPWVTNAFFAALTVALVFRLGQEVFGKDAGLTAAALTAFSPMALLLNGTLMGHTSALFGVTLFLYAYWRLEKGKHALRWGVVAGLTLGMVAANRPLTGVAAALPFAAWSGARLLRTLLHRREDLWRTLRPLAAIGILAALVSLIVPVYNYAATGSASKNLYTLVWNYDQVGFGECCGRAAQRGEGGHDLERGVRHARFDLSLMAADLFGWQLGTIDDQVAAHLQTEGDYYPLLGLSWVLLPFGLLIAFRRIIGAVIAWLLVGAGWFVFAFEFGPATLAADTNFSYLWMGAATLWLLLPFLYFGIYRQPVRVVWMWLLVSITLGLVGAQLMYWIGSQRYSTRYYFEALTALALISALPLAWLARRVGRATVYALLGALLVYSLYFYSTPRIMTLYRFNLISPDIVAGVEARRVDSRPVLVLIEGDNVRWRAFGALMAQTSPYLDSDIVAAWDFGSADARAQILAQFPDRQVIEMQALENSAWFKDEGVVG